MRFMTVAEIERSLSEIDRQLQTAIDEVVHDRGDCNWRPVLENAADLMLKLRAGCDALPDNASVKELLKKVSRQTRTVSELLERAAMFYCGSTSWACRVSGEYARSGLIQRLPNEATVQLRA